MNRNLISALALATMMALSAPPMVQAAETTPSSADGIPAPRFPAVPHILDAIEYDDFAGQIVDALWIPVVPAFVAENPDNPEAARRFVLDKRQNELDTLRRMIVAAVDESAPYLLYAGEQPENPTARVDQDLRSVAALARTADGISATRQLMFSDQAACRLESERGVPATAEEVAACKIFAAREDVQRLGKVPYGAALMDIAATAFMRFHIFSTMMHDSGLSLHRLLPPEQVVSAGLRTSVRDISFDEMSVRYAAQVSGKLSKGDALPPSDISPVTELARLDDASIDIAMPRGAAFMSHWFGQANDCSARGVGSALGSFDYSCSYYDRQKADDEQPPSPFPDLAIGIKNGKILSATLPGKQRALGEDWSCGATTAFPDISLCYHKSVSAKERTLWNGEWQRFFNAAG